MRRRRRGARLYARLTRDDGFTLVELLVVMAIMGVILAPLVGSFTSATAAQVNQTSRFNAEENARLALDRMRKDIHCAHGVAEPITNTSGGQTIYFTQTNLTGTAECPGLIVQGASAVQWCTVPVSGETSRFRLYRENDANNNCDGTHAVFQVDYLVSATVWTTPTCTPSSYPTVGVTIPVNTDPTRRPQGGYTLSDNIALRNADPCS